MIAYYVGKMESSIKTPIIVNDSGNDASELKCQCLHHNKSISRDRKKKRLHKFSNTSQKPLWYTRKRSKIKLPSRFLLGGTISDPLNLRGLQKESDRQSDICAFKTNGRVLPSKRLHRIGFPNITDASDPLNLNNVSSTEPEALSDDGITSIEERKNTDNKSHCQGVPVTSEGMCTLPVDRSEDSLEQQCQCFDSSPYIARMCSSNNRLTLNNGDQHGVEMLVCSIDDCKTDKVRADAVNKLTNNISDKNVPSIFNEMEAGACTHSNRSTSREKIVSPAVSQFSRHQARKRQRRSTHASKETVSSANCSRKSCKRIKEKFPCGNYVAYYGYRNVNRLEDPRLKLLPKELFEGKDVLDIGCNAGLVTIAVACNYLPKRILGIDVDQRLIGLAKRNVRRHMDENSYPSCLKTAFGPITASLSPSIECSAFPHNILFQVGDYVPNSEADLCRQSAEYNVILALSVTKWIHLTLGDDGLRRAFRRMYLQLQSGGKLVLEAQPWASYKRKKKLTEKIYEVYQSISFKPEQFNDYLLSAEVGFSSCELLGTPQHESKGFQRSIYLLTKPYATDVTSSA